MYEHPFRLEIVTPERIVYQSEATSLSAPGTLGGFQVLFNHAPFLSSLEVGALKVRDGDGKETMYATSGGFVEVRSNDVVVLVETAEAATEIDIARARRARERALERLRGTSEAVDEARAQAALARAVNRIRIAGKA